MTASLIQTVPRPGTVGTPGGRFAMTVPAAVVEASSAVATTTPQFAPSPALTDFNEFEIDWLPGRVRWSQFLGARSFHPYKRRLQRTANAATNQRFFYEGDFVEVRALTGQLRRRTFASANDTRGPDAPLLVVLVHKRFEARLLLKDFRTRGLMVAFLDSQMRALMPAILLRVPGLDALETYPEAQPTAGKFAEPVELCRARKRNAVGRPNRERQSQ